MRTLLLFCALAMVCPADQFLTTNDGSKLFFTSSDRLTGTNESFRSKLFSWDSVRGVQLVYESPTDWVANVTITGDGSLAAFDLDAGDSQQRHGALLHLDTNQLEYVGATAIISRNGRYLFTGDSLMDRVLGTSRPLSIQAAFVGSDGSVLYRLYPNFHLIDPDGKDSIFALGSASSSNLVGIDDNATTAIQAYPVSIAIVNTITGQQTYPQTLTPNRVTGPYPLLSSDGQSVAFQVSLPNSGDQIDVCRTDASGCKVVTPPTFGLSLVAFSGDANSVYAISAGHLLRLNVATGRALQVFTQAGAKIFYWVPLVPGSLVRLGTAASDEHIIVNGKEAPILSSSQAGAVIQIPWDLDGSSITCTMYSSDSPFETLWLYTASDFSPQGFTPGNPRVNEGQPAYRQDWSATTYDSPAVPGEIVHIYAVGLGVTECDVKTGQPTPVDRLCRITHQAEWSWTTAPNKSVPAEVLFAGLAPGLTGLYQIDVRVPPPSGYDFIEFREKTTNTLVAYVKVDQQ